MLKSNFNVFNKYSVYQFKLNTFLINVVVSKRLYMRYEPTKVKLKYTYINTVYIRKL